MKIINDGDVAGFVVTDRETGRMVHRESFPSAHLSADALADRMLARRGRLERKFGAGFQVEAGIFSDEAAFDHFFPPARNTPVGAHSFHPADVIEALGRARKAGVSAQVAAWLDADLRPDDNERALIDAIREKLGRADQSMVLLALDTAKQAHQGQTQKGLSSIPYANHCVSVARLVLEQGGSAEAVAAALLHDVPEDTAVKLKRIGLSFGADVAHLVSQVTQPRGQDRDAYLDHVGALTGEALLVKIADRLHNLLRGFTSDDRAYLSRYLDETTAVFEPLFEQPETAPLRPLYDTLVAELKRYAKEPPAGVVRQRRRSSNDDL